MIFGALRIKNEARWIAEVLAPLLALCDKVMVLDDHSTDGTPAICKRLGAKVFRSRFAGFDESRDKDWLLSKIFALIPPGDLGTTSPHWCLWVDGDEVLEPGGGEKIKATIEDTSRNSYSLRIVYLWNSRDQMRVDGVYGRFRRPSLFRLVNPAFRFQTTPWAGNMHCSSVPQELIHGFGDCPARLLHLGYMDRADRMRKWHWYNETDPNNYAEDRYVHMVQGDIPEVPVSAMLVHAGPLELAPV